MENHYLFLQKDFDALERKIIEFKRRLETLFVWMRSSARDDVNTWHDNYEFEEQQRQYQELSRQIQELEMTKQKAVVVLVNTQDATVQVGSLIRVKNKNTGEEKKFLVGSYLVLEKAAVEEYSYQSPFLAPFFGARVGDMRSVFLGDTSHEYRVVAITN